jgi:hypothetical protein
LSQPTRGFLPFVGFLCQGNRFNTFKDFANPFFDRPKRQIEKFFPRFARQHFQPPKHRPQIATAFRLH